MARQIDLTVARRPLDRRAADMLREQILGGGFPPGHRLVEARLEAAVAGQRRGAAAAADSALHKTIVALSGHRRLVEHYRIIEQQVQRYIASSNALLADPGDLVTQHAPLVGAVLAGKAVQAE